MEDVSITPLMVGERRRSHMAFSCRTDVQELAPSPGAVARMTVSPALRPSSDRR
jgi:hypothetical protein